MHNTSIPDKERIFNSSQIYAVEIISVNNDKRSLNMGLTNFGWLSTKSIIDVKATFPAS